MLHAPAWECISAIVVICIAMSYDQLNVCTCPYMLISCACTFVHMQCTESNAMDRFQYTHPLGISVAFVFKRCLNSTRLEF